MLSQVSSARWTSTVMRYGRRLQLSSITRSLTLPSHAISEADDETSAPSAMDWSFSRPLSEAQINVDRHDVQESFLIISNLHYQMDLRSKERTVNLAEASECQVRKYLLIAALVLFGDSSIGRNYLSPRLTFRITRSISSLSCKLKASSNLEPAV